MRTKLFGKISGRHMVMDMDMVAATMVAVVAMVPVCPVGPTRVRLTVDLQGNASGKAVHPLPRRATISLRTVRSGRRKSEERKRRSERSNRARRRSARVGRKRSTWNG